eukprot:68841_1
MAQLNELTEHQSIGIPQTLKECTDDDILAICPVIMKQLNQHIDMDNVKRLMSEQKIDGESLHNMPQTEFVNKAKQYDIDTDNASILLDGITRYFHHSTESSHGMLFSDDDLDEIQNAMDEHRMNWMYIANCVHHEMYPKLANVMRSLVNSSETNVGLYDLDQVHIDTIIHSLKRGKLVVEERRYLRKLCQRALGFIAFTPANRNNDHDGDDHKKKIFDLKYKGLNADLLRDIFDVHRHFKFSSYHFYEYSVQQFRNDIIEASPTYLDQELAHACMNVQFKERFNLYPSYIIADDMFQTSNYMFSVSHYVHLLRDKTQVLDVKLVIIPKAVHCVYDENSVFQYDIGNIDYYLHEKHIFDYHRTTDRNYPIDVNTLRNGFDIDCFDENISQLVIIIDRRQSQCSKDILYMFCCDSFSEVKGLNMNYFIGLDFSIVPTESNHNKIIAHLRYGINEKCRFYPEMLLSLIPRLFKRPSNTSSYDLLRRMYSHEYKHGWRVDLSDPLFDKYYKQITGFTHVSVNSNRILLAQEYSAAREIIFFRDLMEHEMITNHISPNVMAETIAFLVDEEYDSESIVDDVQFEASNIGKYLVYSGNAHANAFSIIQTIVKKYTDPSESTKPRCTEEDVSDVTHCPHINYLLQCLTLFNRTAFVTNEYDYDISRLMSSYDHMIAIHQHHHYDRIKEYFADHIEYCTVKDCPVLQRHTMRQRELEPTTHNDIESKKDESDANEESLKGIVLSATLNAMHCYISHKEKHLFRLEKSKTNLHFTTSKDEHDDVCGMKAESALSIKFGVSVLEWLEHHEKPEFTSFHEEIVRNGQSTINQKRYLEYAQECFLKMIGNKYEQYTLKELMSLKLYTDTNGYQSAFRKAFWKSSSKALKKSFYHWAIELYKAFIFHSRPTPQRKKPRPIFHGLNMVFVLDNNLPMYSGPISTSLEESVAHTFSQGTGLIWTIQPSYANTFKRVTGISVSWISCYDNEDEFLLVNQYLPIVSTRNFDNDVNHNVDHLLFSLKSFQKPIRNVDDFFNVIGLRYDRKDKKEMKPSAVKYNPEWVPIMQNNKQLLLYHPTAIPSKCLLERVHEELKIDLFPMRYKVLSSKFQIIPHFAFNYYSIRMPPALSVPRFHDFVRCAECYIIDDDTNIRKMFSYNAISIHRINDSVRKSMQICIKNKAMFGCDEWIKIQDVNTIIFKQCTRSFYDKLQIIRNKLISLRAHQSIQQYHEEILHCKYLMILNADRMRKYIEPSELADDHHSDCYRYQFDDLGSLHFTIPYKVDLENVTIYIQFKDNYNYVLFKTFDIALSKHTSDALSEVTYLLSVLKIYNYPIANSQAFLEHIRIRITPKHISILKDSDILKTEPRVLDVLIDDLNIYQLSMIRQAQQTDQSLKHEKLLNLARANNIDANQLLQAERNALNKQHRLGQTVTLKDGAKGVIKFMDKTRFSDGDTILGIELNEWSPNGSDGTRERIQYFTSKPGFAYFVYANALLDDINHDRRNFTKIPVQIGDSVVTRDGYQGLVRFKGGVRFSKHKQIGIELRTWSPNAGNGIVNGQKYFDCPHGFAYFVPRNAITESTSAQQKTQSTMFGKLGRQMFGTGKRRKPHDNHKYINNDLKLSNRQRKKIQWRVLVMGPDDSDITTMFSQWQRLHSHPTQEELQLVAPSVQDAVVGFIKVLCFQSKRLYETDGENTKIKEENESLRQEILNLNAPYKLNTQLASKIAFLWADHGIKETFRLRVKFQISENAEYFLDRIMVIGQDHYKPDLEDCMRIKALQSTGIRTITLQMTCYGLSLVEMIHIAGEISQRKYIQVVSGNIMAVVIVISMDTHQRITEGLNFFKRILEAGIIPKRLHVMIFLTRYDSFEEQLRNVSSVPITDILDDYPESEDPRNEESVFRFIRENMLELSAAKLSNIDVYKANTIQCIYNTINKEIISIITGGLVIMID